MNKEETKLREEAQETAHAEPELEDEKTPDGAQAPEAAEDVSAAEAIEKLMAERDEYLEMAKRQMAEFANYRRRTENARKEAEAEGRQDAVRAFLPVVDNLERALEAAAEDSPLRSGVEMVMKQTQSVLESLSVEVIDPLGEPFDAETMNAVLQGTEDEGEPGSVCQVLQKGYRIGERVVRHAMVKVVAG